MFMGSRFGHEGRPGMTAEFFRGQAVEPVVGNVDPGVDMKTPPKVLVDTKAAPSHW